MRAIIDINGKQYQVEEGRYIQVDKFPGNENDEVVLGNVCLVVAGEQSLLGAPYIDGATVKTRIKRHGKGPKVLVYKMHRKKGYRRKNGHRQEFTELMIDRLEFPGRDNMPQEPATEKAAPKTTGKSKAKSDAAPAAEEKPKASKAKKPVEAPVAEAPAKTSPKQKAAPAEAVEETTNVAEVMPAEETENTSAPATEETSSEA